MHIGLIDVDGHHYPNLALMRISAWHKAQGDTVEWWYGDMIHYDIVYKSKVFSDAYSKDTPDPINADLVIKGGTGYHISLDENGKEVFDSEGHKDLPPEMERMFPDYSIYPEYPFAVSMTSRGCPRNCAFCHVAKKEGRGPVVKVANVSDFWCGQDEIRILDPNITACRQKRELMRQYIETGARLDFTQGLDIRLLDEEDMLDINKMRLRTLHFAWDNPNEDLQQKFMNFAKNFRRKSRVGMVYVLTGFEDVSVEEHIKRALARIIPLREMKFDPYVMIYDKPNAPRELKRLQRWCNNKIIFKSCPDFADYKG